MRKKYFVFLFIFLLIFSCIKKREVKVISEKTIVGDIIYEFVQGLEKADVDKVLSFYNISPNTFLIGTEGELLSGYDDVESYYRELMPFLSEWQNRDFSLEGLKIRIIDGVAWFHSLLKLKYEIFEKLVEKNVRFSGVLIEEEGIWKLVQVHMSESSP